MSEWNSSDHVAKLLDNLVTQASDKVCEKSVPATMRLFGSTTRVTQVSLTDTRNINSHALQAERFVLLSDKSNLFYQGHTGLRSRTVRCQ